MEADLKKLLEEINFFQNEDINEDHFNKVHGIDDLKPGDKVEIFWKDREESDKGYIFNLPHQYDWDEYDVCVHVNDVDNSDGIDEAPDEYHHLYYLASLERVKKIKKC